MTTKQKVIWWIYVLWGIILLRFVGPWLISETDTIMVLLGVLLLILYGVCTYYLWMKPVFLWSVNKLKDDYK